MDEQLHRQKGRVHKEVEQQGKRVRAAWVQRVRRPVHLLWQEQQLQMQLTVTYRMDIMDFRMTQRRVPAVDKVVMDPSAQGQGLGKEHGICKELQGRAELQRKVMERRLLWWIRGQCMGERSKWQWTAAHQLHGRSIASTVMELRVRWMHRMSRRVRSIRWFSSGMMSTTKMLLQCVLDELAHREEHREGHQAVAARRKRRTP